MRMLVKFEHRDITYPMDEGSELVCKTISRRHITGAVNNRADKRNISNRQNHWETRTFTRTGAWTALAGGELNKNAKGTPGGNAQ